MHSSGHHFRTLINESAPVQILGAINAYCAKLAESAGAKALYLSGAGVANAAYGIPDLGMTNLSQVLEEARRLIDASSLPLLVDVDTGWGHVFNIARTVKLMEQAGVAAIHIEDQQIAKRCGHRPNKKIVSVSEMGDRIKAAVDARIDPEFVIMARTDALASEGMDAALERVARYIEWGADMIFPEAITSLEEYRRFSQSLNVPILANITEFGKTPLFTRDELKQASVALILYPLSAFRAMSQAALTVYQTIINDGTQRDCIDFMQTREGLYDILHYHDFEKTLDQFADKGDQDE